MKSLIALLVAIAMFGGAYSLDALQQDMRESGETKEQVEWAAEEHPAEYRFPDDPLTDWLHQNADPEVEARWWEEHEPKIPDTERPDKEVIEDFLPALGG